MNKRKIKIVKNGYWISDNWFYLDTYKSIISKEITYQEFEDDFCGYSYNLDWDEEYLGNNPFTQTCCKRYFLDNEKMFVEVCVFTGIETEFYIHKVITNNYSNSNDLVKDLMELNEIYDYLISSFENYRRDIIDDKSL